jgi:hypothetical protein
MRGFWIGEDRSYSGHMSSSRQRPVLRQVIRLITRLVYGAERHSQRRTGNTTEQKHALLASTGQLSQVESVVYHREANLREDDRLF